MLCNSFDTLGQYELESSREAIGTFVKTLPVRKVGGVGKVTEKVLQALDINTCEDLVIGNY